MKFLPIFTIALIFMSSIAPAEETVLFDFETEGQGSDIEWVAVNDGVMGGLSQGGPKISDSVLTFSGTLSLENNGGFSSCRTKGEEFDLSGATGIKLRVKGDGRKYQVRMECAGATHWSRPVSFSTEFVATEGEWIEVKVPFADLDQSFRGRTLSGHIFDTEKIQMIGLLIGDKKAGDFLIEVDSISTYTESE